MSADNGVYILSTPSRDDPTHREYRVAHAQSIDNISADPETNDLYLVLIFGKSKVYSDQQVAKNKAHRIESEILHDCGVLEYGVCSIDWKTPFPEITTEGAITRLQRLENHKGYSPAAADDANTTANEIIFRFTKDASPGMLTTFTVETVNGTSTKFLARGYLKDVLRTINRFLNDKGI